MGGKDTIDYSKFSNRVCNLREAGFITVGFFVAVSIVAAILLGIYFGTKCGDDEVPCKSSGTTCVPKGQVCDGQYNCPLGEDEWECHVSEFYVSFRTKENYNDVLNENSTNHDQVLFNSTKRRIEEQVLRVIQTAYGNSTVNVFRFRGVTLGGLAGGEKLAVDSLIKLPPGGKVTVGTGITPENITNVIVGGLTNELEAHIDPRSEQEVTTGVGVVLRAFPESTCRLPVKYCPNYCEPKRAYVFGTTKGCPECTCTAEIIETA